MAFVHFELKNIDRIREENSRDTEFHKKMYISECFANQSGPLSLGEECRGIRIVGFHALKGPIIGALMP